MALWLRRPLTSPLPLTPRLPPANLRSSTSRSTRRQSRPRAQSTPFARRRRPHRLKISQAEKKRARALARDRSVGWCSLALADHAFTALLNDRRPAASRRLLAHFNRAHPVLGLDPYGKAATADDDTHVRCGTFLDDPTTLGRRFLNDVEVRQRGGRDCRQPNANHQSLHHVSLLVGRTQRANEFRLSPVPYFFRGTISQDHAVPRRQQRAERTVVTFTRPPIPRAESRAPAIASRRPRSCVAGRQAPPWSARRRHGRARNIVDRQASTAA